MTVQPPEVGFLTPLPRAVFLDLKMPRVDGWEVLRRIRASRRTARLPVVVVSESEEPDTAKVVRYG